MRISYLCFLTLLTLSTVFACSGPQLYRVEQNNLNALQKPGADTARVVFIRPQKGLAGQGVAAVYDDDALIGGLSAYSYFAYDAQPGKHIFGCYATSSGMDFLEADIDGGRTYYAQCSYQDRVLELASKLIAVKKDSDIMESLPGMLPDLTRSSLTDEGVNMFTAKQEESGVFIVDERAAMVTYRTDIRELRKKWLKKAKVVQKPRLLTEDGR